MRHRPSARIYYLVFTGLLLISLTSCGKVPSKSDNAPAPMMSIYDTIVKMATDAYLMGQEKEDYFELSLFDDSTISQYNLSDLIISYSTPGGADDNKWLYNFVNDRWDQVSYEGGFGNFLFTRHTKSLTRLGLKFAEYISTSSKVRIKSDHSYIMDTIPVWKTCAYGIKFHPGFKPIIRDNQYFEIGNNLAHDGDNYWSISGSTLFKFNDDGEVLLQVNIPGYQTRYLSYSNGYFSYLSWPDSVYVINSEFELVYKQPIPHVWTSGLALSDKHLWLTYELGEDSTRMLRYLLPDPDDIAYPIVWDTIDVAQQFSLYTFDGTNLIGKWGRNLYIVTVSGVVVDSTSIPNLGIRDMDYQNGIMYIKGSNPNGIDIGGGFIAPFRYGR